MGHPALLQHLSRCDSVKPNSSKRVPLVAPYCAIPRDYLSDTPLLCAMGFLVSQHGQMGAFPPPPFPEHFPLGESMRSGGLVAPYRAIPRDYLSDTPLLRAMGFLVSQHGELGAIPPFPFLSLSPLESMRSGGAIPPPQKGYLSDTL